MQNRISDRIYFLAYTDKETYSPVTISPNTGMLNAVVRVVLVVMTIPPSKYHLIWALALRDENDAMYAEKRVVENKILSVNRETSHPISVAYMFEGNGYSVSSVEGLRSHEQTNLKV